MAYHFDGKAIFSTRNGEYARRQTVPSMRTVLRSNPVEDQQTMVANLQREFPEECKAITSPITDTDVYEYFDYCDAAVQGFEFLRAALEYIAALNASANAEKAIKVQDFVGRWKNTNGEAFTHIQPYHAVTDLFTGTYNSDLFFPFSGPDPKSPDILEGLNPSSLLILPQRSKADSKM